MMKTTLVFVGFLLLATAIAQQHDEPRPNGAINGIPIGQDGQSARGKGIGLSANPLGVALASLGAFGTMPTTGAIKGTVVDAAGNPVASAQVSTGYDLDSKAVEVWAGQVPTFETDANGHFVVTNLVEGHHYKVYAMKEEAGYPNMMNSLFNPRDEAPIAGG